MKGSRLDPEAIPAELRERPQWVVWKLLRRQERKATKIPFSPSTGGAASVADPATWGTFAAALDRVGQGGYDGVGFVFAEDDPYTGIDLDFALDEEGELEPWARPIVEAFASYAERSPGGRGLHIIVRGIVPDGRGHRRELRKTALRSEGAEAGAAVEMYSSTRFFTVTSEVWPAAGPTIAHRQPELYALYTAVMGPHDTSATSRHATPSELPAALSEDDEELLAVGVRRLGPAFGRLIRGDRRDYEDTSEADFGAIRDVLRLTGGDADRAERILRDLPLKRDKWDSPRGGRTWLRYSIDRALESGLRPLPSTDGSANGNAHAASAALAPLPPTEGPAELGALRAALARSEAELASLRGELERSAAEVRRLRAERHWIERALAVPNERWSATEKVFYLAYAFRRERHPRAAGLQEEPRAALAAASGLSESTVSSTLGRLHAGGLLGVEHKYEQVEVPGETALLRVFDPESGRIEERWVPKTRPNRRLFIDGPTDVASAAQLLVTKRPPDDRGHGGLRGNSRGGCEHPAAARERRLVTACGACGEVLPEEELPPAAGAETAIDASSVHSGSLPYVDLSKKQGQAPTIAGEPTDPEARRVAKAWGDAAYRAAERLGFPRLMTRDGRTTLVPEGEWSWSAIRASPPPDAADIAERITERLPRARGP